MSKRIRLALVGIGKIARDQHLPAIAANPDLELVAIASRNATVAGVPGFPDIAALIESGPPVDAVSFATPPGGRYEQARAALDAGLDVMLEKPPTATLSEAAELIGRATAAGRSLFFSWHSREAAGVEPAREWLRGRRIDAVRIRWMEDIRVWHPGQEWILAPGGFGVFDPAINALSILTRLLDEAVVVRKAAMDVPEGRAAPLAATLDMAAGPVPVGVELDFLQTGPQSWDIAIDTDAGTATLALGGSSFAPPGAARVGFSFAESRHRNRFSLPEPTSSEQGENREYARLYARFADLVRARQSDTDLRPLQLVADAFLLAERRVTAPFTF